MPACRPLFTDFSLHMVGKVKYFLLDEKVFDLYELVNVTLITVEVIKLNLLLCPLKNSYKSDIKLVNEVQLITNFYPYFFKTTL